MLPDLLTALTGVAPPSDPPRKSYAGYTAHPPLRVRNRYLDVRVPVWCDEIPMPRRTGQRSRDIDEDSTSGTNVAEAELLTVGGVSSKGSEGHQLSSTEPATTRTWLSQMLSPEAREVRDAIGAVILILPLPQMLHPSPSDPWKLKPQFLDLASTVNRLSRAIEDERTRVHDVDGTDPDFPVGAGDSTTILILQGSLPQPSHQEPSERAFSLDEEARPEMTDEDHLIESVEDQLVEGREVTGWDVVAWDGIIDQTSQLPKYQASAPVTTEGEKQRRNIHGELTGLARVLEVLGSCVDWEAAPVRDTTGVAGDTASSSPAAADHPALRASEDKDTFPPSSKTALQSSSASFLAPLLDKHNGDNADLDNADSDGDDDDNTQEVQVEQLGALMQRAMAIREMGGSRAEKERALSALLRGL